MSPAAAPRAAPGRALAIRDLGVEDARAVARIDARHTGARKPRYWRRVLRTFVTEPLTGDGVRIAIAADDGRRLAGYVLGEVRAFEFGSEPCGWICAIGVDPSLARRGIASALVLEARRRFAASGVRCVRTMVRRNEVPVLSFFRRIGFVGGPFVQLELDAIAGGGAAAPLARRRRT